MDARRRSPLRRSLQGDDLCACPRCRSVLVQETDAQPCGDGRWEVERWCPECGWSGVVRCSAQAWLEFGEHLRSGRDRLATLLGRIAAA